MTKDNFIGYSLTGICLALFLAPPFIAAHLSVKVARLESRIEKLELMRQWSCFKHPSGIQVCTLIKEQGP